MHFTVCSFAIFLRVDIYIPLQHTLLHECPSYVALQHLKHCTECPRNVSRKFLCPPCGILQEISLELCFGILQQFFVERFGDLRGIFRGTFRRFYRIFRGTFRRFYKNFSWNVSEILEEFFVEHFGDLRGIFRGTFWRS